MTLQEALTLVNRLAPRDKLRLIDELTHQLLAEDVLPNARPVPATGAELRGLLADLGPAPTLEEIREARKEMWEKLERTDRS
jgi:hypothetical protein